MIIKSSTRGSRGLGAHLAAGENERAQVTRADGIISYHPRFAVAELTAQGASSATASPLVHASISPDQEMTADQWDRAWGAWEQARGLHNQPFIEVEHEKAGRVHRHRVYSRVDADRGAAIRQSHEYRVNERVARQLELELGHELTPGRHTRAVVGWALENQPELAQRMAPAAEGPRPEAAMSHDGWQQQQRTGVDARDLASAVADAWQRSDNAAAFTAALEEQGLSLAQGRKTPQILDRAGEAHDLRRTLRSAGENVKAAHVRSMLPAGLEAVEQVKDQQRAAAREAAAAHPTQGHGPSGQPIDETDTDAATAPATAAQEPDAPAADHAAVADRVSDPVAQAREHVEALEQAAAKSPFGVKPEQAKTQALREFAPEFRAHETAYDNAKQEHKKAKDAADRAEKRAGHYSGFVGALRAIRHPVDAYRAGKAFDRASEFEADAASRFEAEKEQRKEWKKWASEPENKEHLEGRAGEIRAGLDARYELPAARRELRQLEREHEPQQRHEHEHERDGPQPQMGG
jgi:hypothetical protein